MSKSAEAQIEVEERRKEMAQKAFDDAVQLYCAMSGCPPEWVDDPFRLLNAHHLSACLVVAMLGPKLDAILERLNAIAPNVDQIERLAQLENEARHA